MRKGRRRKGIREEKEKKGRGLSAEQGAWSMEQPAAGYTTILTSWWPNSTQPFLFSSSNQGNFGTKAHRGCKAKKQKCS